MSDSSFRKRTLAPLIENIRNGFQYFCIVAYFWPWSYKATIRHWLKVSSLWTLLISTGLLLAEVALELIGGERLQKWISPEHIIEVDSCRVT
jgi:hypothetical protein